MNARPGPFARRVLLGMAALGALSCVPSARPATSSAVGSHRAKAPPPPPARWVRTNEHAVIGPEVAGGTLVLLGGRRAVVAPDGRVAFERVAAPEEIDAIASIAPARLDPMTKLVLGEVGALVDRDDEEWLRIGWGPLAAP